MEGPGWGEAFASGVQQHIHPSPIIDAASCNSHCWCMVGGFPFTWLSGLNSSECATEGGSCFGISGVWIGGGNVHTTDCGGIYGGDTFVTRQGIMMGSSVLEETRSAKPTHGLHYQIVESDDNINYRHTENQDSSYFPNDVASDLLQSIGVTVDSNAQDNIKYDSNFSSLNDIRTAIPLPLKNVDQNNYPTRTVRSTRTDSSGVIDNYRIWLANQFKDFT